MKTPHFLKSVLSLQTTRVSGLFSLAKLGLLLGSLVGLLMSPAFSATPVVKIGKRTIFKEKVDSLVKIVVQQQFAGKELQAEEKKQLVQMVASNLIGQELLEIEADARKITVSSTEVDSLFKEFKKNFPDSNTYKQAIKSMGIPENQVKSRMGKEIRISKVLKNHLQTLSRPTETEIKSFYDKNTTLFTKSDSLRASQIFLPLPDRASPEKIEEIRKKLASIREKLSVSMPTEALLEAFTRLAINHSQSPEAQKGGDLGRFKKGDFFPEFNKAIATLKVGQLSQVFRSPQGFHLVLLTEKHDGTLESNRLRILHHLVNEQTMENQQKLAQLFDSLYTKYKVEVLNPAYGGMIKNPGQTGSTPGSKKSSSKNPQEIFGK